MASNQAGSSAAGGPGPASKPQAPRAAIRKLDQDTVNRIAAGEVIQRPSNALKEMIENSLDAGATNIGVLVKNGGLQLLQIVDNGTGIHKEDFPLLCERFATSKLSSFDDLLDMRTYGFRGEALASISFVAKVTVTSMVPGAPCAYKASFANGKMIGDAKPAAGVKGTSIAVEDMFYNVPARRAAFKNTNEEYARILEVVQRYAIFSGHRGVAFSCKKHSDVVPDVNVPSKTAVIDSIASVYGASIKRELLPLEVKVDERVGAGDGAGDGAGQQEGMHFTATGWVSSANYSLKRAVFILFINGRLVDCSPLRRSMESVYGDLLPKGSHPFVYMDLQLPPGDVDVNVHPTKREVGFLHQDEIVTAITGALNQRLAGAHASRTFATHAVLPLPPLTAPGPSGPAGQALGLLPIDGPASAGAAGSQRVPQPSASSSAAAGAGGGGAAPMDDDDVGLVPVQQTALATSYKSVQTSLASFAATGTSSAEIDAADQRPSAKLRKGQPMPAPAPAPYVPQKLVRVAADSHGTLEKFLAPVANTGLGASTAAGASSSGGPDIMDVDDGLMDTTTDGGGRPNAGANNGTAHAARKAKRSRASAIPVQLTSVRQLLGAIESEAHAGLTAAMRRHVLVGVVDRHTSLIQYNTRLLLINHTQLARELFYQRAVVLFGNVESFALSPAPDVEELALMALRANGLGTEGQEDENGDDQPATDRRALASSVALLLSSKADMLAEYFGIRIEAKLEQGQAQGQVGREDEYGDMEGQGEAAGDSVRTTVRLTHLPRLVDGHSPVLSYTPDFLLQLAWDVDWAAEKPCFHGVAQALAAFYAHPPPIPKHLRAAMGMDSGAVRPTSSTEDGTDGAGHSEASAGAGASSSASGPRTPTTPAVTDSQVEAYRTDPTSVYWRTQHVLLPAMRATGGGEAGESGNLSVASGFLCPRKLARDHAVVQVACTEQLYRIFERC